MNFIRIAFFTTISNKCCHCQCFIQNVTHKIPLVCYNIEVCNIDNIITMHIIFDINRLWIGCSSNHLNVRHILFIISLFLIAFSFQFSDSGIRLSCANTAVWRFVDFVDYRRNPCLISFERLRFTFFKQFIFRKQFFSITITEYTVC